LVLALSYEGCDGVTRHTLKVTTDGAISEVNNQVLKKPTPGCVIGRRPHGLRQQPARPAQNALGAYFSDMAMLEAASVHAFERLERELSAHRAPRRLIVAARSAAHDEARHARVTTRLAKRFGSRPLRPTIDPAPLRTLADLAIENEAEGCVRETFGALLGTYQAARAHDPQVARALRQIAVDERRHAKLAWAVSHWSAGRLSRAHRARVRDSRREAVALLSREIDRVPSSPLVLVAGLPSTSVVRHLHSRAQRELWRI
jgi:hypothetical protein